MSKNSTTEEKSPLLFPDDGKCGDNDKPKMKNRVHFDKSRLRDISAGTTAVFTQFPNYIGTWWVSTAFFSLLFFMMILLLISTITVGTLRIPRCVANDEFDNRTVHLVHSGSHWRRGEVEIIEKIIENYKNYKVHLMVVNKDLWHQKQREIQKQQNIDQSTELRQALEVEDVSEYSSTTEKGKKKKKKNDLIKRHRSTRKANKDSFKAPSFNVEAKRLLDLLLRGKIWEKNFTEQYQVVSSNSTNVASKLSTITTTTSATSTTSTSTPTVAFATFNDLLAKYPDVIVLENTTFNRAFFGSPLYAYWKDMNHELKVFAVRVLQLWQYGGISFDLKSTHKSPTSNSTFSDNSLDKIFNKKVLRFVLTEKAKYESLANGVVAADDEGLHMESKVPCHAFFGQVLMTLRQARPHTTVRSVLKSAIGVFCKHFAVEKKYCDKIDS